MSLAQQKSETAAEIAALSKDHARKAGMARSLLRYVMYVTSLYIFVICLRVCKKQLQPELHV